MSLGYEEFLAQKTLYRPAWVLELVGSPTIYFSNVPANAVPYAYACMVVDALPSIKLPQMGGGAVVTTATLKFFDIQSKAGTNWATSIWGYRSATGATHHGKMCRLYLGDATAPLLSDYVCRFRGYVRDIAYRDGCWTVVVEDGLGRSKDKSLEVPESWFAVANHTHAGDAYDGYKPKDLSILIKKRKRSPAIPAPVNLVSNGDFSGGTVGSWTVDVPANATLTGDATKGFGTADGCAVIQSTAAGEAGDLPALVRQDVTLSTVRTGDTYGALVYAQRSTSSTASDKKYQLRVCLKALDPTNAIKDYAHGVARKVEPGSGTGDWSLHSNSLTITDTTATKIRVEVHVLTGTSYPVRVDAIRLYRLSAFALIKREVYGVVSIDESGSTDSMMVTHSVLATRENAQPKDKKGRFVKVVAGHGAHVLQRLMTTTSTAGSNGTCDVGDGFGLGIPVEMIDTSSFNMAVSNYPDHRFCFVLPESIPDPVDFFNKELLEPMGAWLYQGFEGKFRLQMIEAPVTPLAVTDVDLASRTARPELACYPSERYTRLVWLCDHDVTGNAVESNRDNDPWSKRGKNIKMREGEDTDPQMVGRWEFNEYDFRVDGIFMDQARANEALYGKIIKTVKSKGVRSMTSAAIGMPCPLYNYAGTIAEEYAWRGEAIGRSLAERTINWFSSPVYRITWPGFASWYTVNPGASVSVTSSFLPGIGTAPAMGVTDVKGRITEMIPDPKALTMKIVVTVMDGAWCRQPPINRPTVGSVTTPTFTGTPNVKIDIVTQDELNAGNFEWIPKGNFLMVRFQHRYGGIANIVPNFAGYAYTELRVQWSVDGPWYKVLRTTNPKALVVLPSVSPNPEQYALHQAKFRVYWRDVAGTYYGTPTTNEITLGNADTPGGSGWADSDNPDSLD